MLLNIIVSLLLLINFAVVTPAMSASPVQSRDFLTATEADQIREAQAIDKRIEALIVILDRRLAALGVAQDEATIKQTAKTLERYGELRTGTPNELLADINNTVNSAADNIDDAAQREQQQKLLSKALKKLQLAAARIKPQLGLISGKATDDASRRYVAEILETLDAILAAQAPEPKPSPKP